MGLRSTSTCASGRAPEPAACARAAGRAGAGPRLVGALALGTLAACAPAEDAFELYWRVVDVDGRGVFPGAARDTCALWARAPDGRATTVELRARVELSALECDDDPQGPCCGTPCAFTFSCRASRGFFGPSADASPGRFRISLTPVLRERGRPPFVPRSGCASGPGPRVRRWIPGRTADLGVWVIQLSELDLGLLDGGQGRLELAACDPALEEP